MLNINLNYSNLLNYLEIEKIIIFGTLTSQSSDLDLVIVSDDFDDMFTSKRVFICKEYLKTNSKLDIICLTNNEFRRLNEHPSEFSINILLKGNVLYER